MRGRRRAASGAALVTCILVAAAMASAAAATAGGGEPRRGKDVAAPRVIIDTDLSRWWDDASTIGIANVLHDRGDLRLLAVVSNVQNPLAVAAIDAINTAYGHGRVPVGDVPGSDDGTSERGYTEELVQRLPHSIDDSTDAPDAVEVYRRVLARQPDDSVTIVSLGGYTNLADLLASKPGQGSKLDGRALVDKKVDRLVQMDGIFPAGGPAFTNQKIDLAAANEVVADDAWPTPIAWVDGLGGIQTKVGAPLCTDADAEHPLRIVYEALFACGEPGDGNWDAPTLLYAIGDLEGTFSEEGRGGAAVINADGGLSWQIPSSRPADLYVHVVDQDSLNARIEELLLEG